MKIKALILLVGIGIGASSALLIRKCPPQIVQETVVKRVRAKRGGAVDIDVRPYQDAKLTRKEKRKMKRKP